VLNLYTTVLEDRFHLEESEKKKEIDKVQAKLDTLMGRIRSFEDDYADGILPPLIINV